jgi:predicted secreted hydrolase
VLLQGVGGYSRKGARPAQASYYYSLPQLATRGTIARAGGKPEAVTGTAWLDHEWFQRCVDRTAAGTG